MKKIIQKESVWIILVGLVVFSIVIVPDFATGTNIWNILCQSGIIGALTIGESLILLSGNLDLSPGALVALCSVVTTYSMRSSMTLGILVGLGTCIGIGSISGLLVSRLKIPSLIATLGTMGIARSLAFTISGGLTVSGVKKSFAYLGSGSILHIPIPIILVILSVACMSFVLKYTVWGRNVYAIGGNEYSAFFSGIRVDKIKLSVFVLAGLFYAIGGLIYTSRISSGTPEGGVGYELDAITASVLGGISLFGGRGKIRNSLAGALILSIIANLMNLKGISPYSQGIIKGILFVVIVGLRKFLSRSYLESSRAIR